VDVQGNRQDHVRIGQFSSPRGTEGEVSQGCKAGQCSVEFERADQRGDRFTVMYRRPGQVKGKCVFQAQSAEVVPAGVKWDAAAGAPGRVDIGNVCKTVAAEKRNFTAGKAPVTFKAVGGEEQFLQRFKKKFKHYFASPRVCLVMRKISSIEGTASP
jgi:hypothetical protein